jgi:hypothetical protein
VAAGCRGLAGEGGVDPLDADHGVAVEADLAQRREHGIGGGVTHVELDGVSVRPARGAGAHYDVLDPGGGGEPVGQRLGESGRAD